MSQARGTLWTTPVRPEKGRRVVKVTPAMHAAFQKELADPLRNLRVLAQWLEFADGAQFIPAVEAAIKMMEAKGKLPQRERNG